MNSTKILAALTETIMTFATFWKLDCMDVLKASWSNVFIDSEIIKDVFTTGLYANPGGAGGVCGGEDGFGD